jgi:hypothetical protein
MSLPFFLNILADYDSLFYSQFDDGAWVHPPSITIRLTATVTGYAVFFCYDCECCKFCHIFCNTDPGDSVHLHVRDYVVVIELIRCYLLTLLIVSLSPSLAMLYQLYVNVNIA